MTKTIKILLLTSNIRWRGKKYYYSFMYPIIFPYLQYLLSTIFTILSLLYYTSTFDCTHDHLYLLQF